MRRRQRSCYCAVRIRAHRGDVHTGSRSDSCAGWTWDNLRKSSGRCTALLSTNALHDGRSPLRSDACAGSRARLAGQAPEDIRQYWVEIDGMRWPVKQVLRLATGSSEFQSQTAQRHLRKLGFRVGGEAMPRGGAPRTRMSPASFDLNDPEVIESVDIRV